MNITVRQIEFQVGPTTIYGWIYTPSTPVRAVVQIVHGMTEHMGRYHDFMNFLARNGYAVCGIDQCGHGRTAAGKYGFFAEQDGWKLLVECQRKFNKILRSELPHNPIILMGHSMGSFVARVCIAKYPKLADGLILSGTGRGGLKAELAIQLANHRAHKYGAGYIDHTLDEIAFGGFSKQFPQHEGKRSWLSQDAEQVRVYNEDEASGFVFSSSAFRDLFILIRNANDKRSFESVDTEMPILLISGALDPVGENGKGPREVCERYVKAGATNVELMLYKDGRHEMLNELDRGWVYIDLLDWLRKRFAECE